MCNWTLFYKQKYFYTFSNISSISLLIRLITVYREGYIESMSEHVNIHIYGNCGAPCPGDSPLGCLQYLARSVYTHLDLISHISNYTPHTSCLDLILTPHTSLCIILQTFSNHSPASHFLCVSSPWLQWTC